MLMLTHTGLAPDAPDVPVAGWDAASGERYTFLYAADGYCLPLGGGSGTAAAAVLPEGGGLLMKALALGPGLMCATLAVAAGEPQVCGRWGRGRVLAAGMCGWRRTHAPLLLPPR